jgi:protein PhnA
MSTEQTLFQRCDSKCELCTSDSHLNVFPVQPASDGSAEKSVMICDKCQAQIEQSETVDANHWRCLNDSMWSQVPAVQVMAWRQLKQLSGSGESWANDLLEMLYLEEDVKAWAEAMESDDSDDDSDPTLDSNGAVLKAGDTVTLIKDLDVKGAGFTAKRGTAVRNISLTSNPEHIEGRVNGTRIVLLTCFLKKST